MFLKWVDTSRQVSQKLHIFDCRNCFVRVVIDVLSLWLKINPKYFQVSLGHKIGLLIGEKSRGERLKNP